MRKCLLIMGILLAMTMVVEHPAYASEGGKKSEHAEKKSTHEQSNGGKSEKKKGKEKSQINISDGPANTFYIRMDPMVMPVLGKDDVQETVSMVVALQVSEQKNIAEVSHLLPKIKDAYVSALYGNLNKASYRNGEFLDVNKLKIKLVEVTKNFANTNIIQDVLIQGVSQRRFR